MIENDKRDVDLASITGLSHRTIERAKEGERVYFSTLKRLSETTGIPLQDLQKPAKQRQKAVASA